MEHVLVWYSFFLIRWGCQTTCKKNTIFVGWDKLTQDRKKRMSKKYKFYIHIYIYAHTHTHLGMSQHEVSFFGSKTVALRGKKDTSFWDTPTHTYIYIWDICVKNHVLQQWIASWGAKPTQDKTTVHNT